MLSLVRSGFAACSWCLAFTEGWKMEATLCSILVDRAKHCRLYNLTSFYSHALFTAWAAHVSYWGVSMRDKGKFQTCKRASVGITVHVFTYSIVVSPLLLYYTGICMMYILYSLKPELLHVILVPAVPNHSALAVEPQIQPCLWP